MKADLFNALAEYNSRANSIRMNVASKLTAEEFANTPSPSRESAKTLLLHLFVVEAAYYARCRGEKFNFDLDVVRSFHDVQMPIPDLIVQFVDQSNQTWPFERA